MEKTMTQLEFKVRNLSSVLHQDDLPEFEVEVVNHSDKVVTVCTYLAEHRLLTSVRVWGYAMQVYHPTELRPVTAEDFLELAPGTSWKLRIDLAEASKRGYRLYWESGAPPVTFESDCRDTMFPPSDYDFEFKLGPELVAFTDKPGVCRGGNPQEVWGGASIQLPASLSREELSGKCPVRYVPA